MKDFIRTTVAEPNQSNFGEKGTLYLLDFKLYLYLQDIGVNNFQPYQHYKIETPNNNRRMNSPAVRCSTSKSYNYTNNIELRPLSMFNKNMLNRRDKYLVKNWKLVLKEQINGLNMHGRGSPLPMHIIMSFYYQLGCSL